MTVKKKKKKTVRRKPKRRIRWSVIAGAVLLVAAIAGILYIPRIQQDAKMRTLGYNNDQIELIRKAKIQDEIIANGYYSEYLVSCIQNGTLNKDYLALYTAMSEEDPVTDDTILLYARLLDEGYEEDQLLSLFTALHWHELTPLLVFDYQWNEQNYIDDCLAHRTENSQSHFVLTQDYISEYKVTYEAEDPEAMSVLINTRYYLPQDLEFKDRIELSLSYSIPEQGMREEAANAAYKLCQAGIDNGTAFYITDSYWSYDALMFYYKNYTEADGDRLIGRPGFVESQTGLTMEVTSTFEEGDFEYTEAYKWLSQHCAEYGFIERYPTEKAEITGKSGNPAYYRYLGKELAQKVFASGLTYDEYWTLYLKSWLDESLIPAESVLNGTDYAYMPNRVGGTK